MPTFIKKIHSKKERIETLEKSLSELEIEFQKVNAAWIKAEQESKEALAQAEEKLKAAEAELAKRTKNVRKLETTVKKMQKDKRLADKKRKYLPIVMRETGWDLDTAEAKMERALDVVGASYEHYAIFRFWELTEDEQKTYFTKRDAVTLRRKYNTNKELVKTLMNKDSCCTLLEPFLGRPWMSTKNMTFERFQEKFGNEKKIIYKPTASSGGHGVQVMELSPETLEDVYNQISAKPEGVVEGYLIQHPEMKKLSLNSVNTIRVVTINTCQDVPGIEKNKVNFIYAGMRMGQGSSYVDNLHSGGMMAAVDIETGKVVTGGVDHTNVMHDIHPDTKVPIKGFQIPLFDEVKDLIVRASTDIPGYFGWDIAITETGPVIVEVNTSPGADGLQTPFVPQKKGMRYVIEKYL